MTHRPLQAIKRVLIANRGEIAVRIIKACGALNVVSVAVYAKSDAGSLHVTLADECMLLEGDGTAAYLDIDDILRICKRCHIDAVIPGYGFLSENVKFAEEIKNAGMVFVGPSPGSINEMGLKHRAREVAVGANIPVIPGTELLESEDEALTAAERLGYPVMLKATGGGGGMGLQICHSSSDVSAAFGTIRIKGEKLFKNSGVFLEKYYTRSRHIEVQVFGNGEETVHFGERECSIQRRHQKVIEETPSTFVEARPGLRQKLTKCATDYAKALHYKSAGTVEFLVDDDTGDFFFLEMNTRLQVEHGISELCYGVDLVVLMLRQADFELAGNGGIPSAELQSLVKSEPNGAAIEIRVYAENPYREFAPSPGVFQEVRWPTDESVRVDTWIRSGQRISLHYDPLLAKVMVHAPTREQAISRLSHACSQDITLIGPTTNLEFAIAIINSTTFARGETLTNYLDTRFSFSPCGIDVINPGPYSTIQDYPGRGIVGHGVPRSGPMDNLSSRIANLLVRNPEGTELIEATLAGPKLLFTSNAVVSVCGASVPVSIDDQEQPMWTSLVIEAGQTLHIGAIQDAGCHIYVAIRGGFPKVPQLFGCKSTSAGLRLGGVEGRTLREGDFLHTGKMNLDVISQETHCSLPPTMIPDMKVKEIYVVQGPHDSEEIMTVTDRNMIYETDWKVGHNANRTGVRLVGPSPQWARDSGGEAGSHPSNYLDYGYPTGGMNWGGNSPCIFSVDSPNFGGLICSSTVISAELWKLGQLKPGDTFRMVPVYLHHAVEQIHRVNNYLEHIAEFISGKPQKTEEQWLLLEIPRGIVGSTNAILSVTQAEPGNLLRPRVVYRQGGDRFILMEFASRSSNVAIIARIHQLLEKLRAQNTPKLSYTPHVGSVTIEYDPLEICQHDLLKYLHNIELSIEATVDLSIPCREFRLPLVMDHPDIDASNQRYMQTIRDKAVYLPDNLEYLRKANGLQSRRQVFDLLLDTGYIVVAVGFLLGAPVLYPLSPKFMIGQKYNPTRLSTPGGTFGLGGTMLSGYTTEQPGGYLMVGRTLEMWDAFGTKPNFSPDQPWLFQPFDKITFFEVNLEEYEALAAEFFAGRYQWQVAESTFDVRQIYESFDAARKDPEIIEYKKRQQEGLAEQERLEKLLYEEWAQSAAASQEGYAADDAEDVTAYISNPDMLAITSPMAANVWKVEIKIGDIIKEGQIVAILEAMKMEVNVLTPKGSGDLVVRSILKKPKSTANAGDVIVVAEKQK